MTEGSKKKRVFFLVEGKNDTYIKNIEKDYRIVRTKNPTCALQMRYMDLLPSIRMIESVNCCRINVRSIENAVKMYNAANKLGDYRDISKKATSGSCRS